MTKAEELFHTIASGIPNAKESKMFGALCIKAPNGKAGVMFWKEDMIFKLEENDLKKALGLKGAKIFTPMENRPMMGGCSFRTAIQKNGKTLQKKRWRMSGH
jgi:hypothetical protein